MAKIKWVNPIQRSVRGECCHQTEYRYNSLYAGNRRCPQTFGESPVFETRLVPSWGNTFSKMNWIFPIWLERRCLRIAWVSQPMGSSRDRVPPHKQVGFFFFAWNIGSSSWNILKAFSLVQLLRLMHSYAQPAPRQSCLSLQPWKAPRPVC